MRKLATAETPRMDPQNCQVQVDNDLLAIAREILDSNRSKAEWAEVESDDMFQLGSWCGGFEALEGAFTFSYYRNDGQEFWCTLTIEELRMLVEGRSTTLEVRPSEL